MAHCYGGTVPRPPRRLPVNGNVRVIHPSPRVTRGGRKGAPVVPGKHLHHSIALTLGVSDQALVRGRESRLPCPESRASTSGSDPFTMLTSASTLSRPAAFSQCDPSGREYRFGTSLTPSGSCPCTPLIWFQIGSLPRIHAGMDTAVSCRNSRNI